MAETFSLRWLAFVSLVVVILYRMCRAWNTKRRYQLFKRQNSCEEAPLTNDKLPYGIDRIFTLLFSKADFLVTAPFLSVECRDLSRKEVSEAGISFTSMTSFGAKILFSNTQD